MAAMGLIGKDKNGRELWLAEDDAGYELVIEKDGEFLDCGQKFEFQTEWDEEPREYEAKAESELCNGFFTPEYFTQIKRR